MNTVFLTIGHFAFERSELGRYLQDDDIIRVEPLVHQDLNCIALVGQLRAAAYKVVQAFPGRKYSKTHGCWYVEYEQETLGRLLSSPAHPLQRGNGEDV